VAHYSSAESPVNSQVPIILSQMFDVGTDVKGSIDCDLSAQEHKGSSYRLR
jgi:hypothetical protein